jgi:hypothetical protein
MKTVSDDKEQADLQQLLDANFLEIWTLYLEQNVARQKIMVELAGSPTRACIAQAVYWHELLLLAEAGSESSYLNTVHDIKTNKDSLDAYIRHKKLTATLLSDITAIPFETTRRQLNLMCKENLLQKSREFGFLVNKESAFHAACVDELNPFEKKNLLRLVKKIIGYDQHA